MKFPDHLVLIHRNYATTDAGTGFSVEAEPTEVQYDGWLQPAPPQSRVQETALARDIAMQAETAGLAFSSHVLFGPIGLLAVARKGDMTRRLIDDGLRYSFIADPQDAAGRHHHVECDMSEFRYVEDVQPAENPIGLMDLATYLATHPTEEVETLTFPQPAALAVWDIHHGLARFPDVTVVDSGGNQVEGEVDYVDANNIRLTFAVPFSGTAYLN